MSGKKRKNHNQESAELTQDVRHVHADPLLNLVFDTLEKKRQVLIFVTTRPSSEKSAEEIARKVKDADPEWAAIAQKALNSLSSPTKQCKRLARCLEKGIAFHHSGLTADQRALVENGFREKRIRVICCTPTLAAGVDLPAFRVVIRDLKRYGARGMDFIPVLEYQQMAGRAGRPKYDAWGEAVCIADSDAMMQDIVERYVRGEPEEILSKLAVEPVLRTYILSLIASQVVRTRSELVDFFSRTFWAFQFKDMWRLEFTLDRMLDLLEGWEFIMSSQTSGFRSADELSEVVYRATHVGKRVSELYLDPFTASYLVRCIRTAAGRSAVPHFSWLHAVSNTLEMRPLLRTKMKEFDAMQDALARVHGDLLAQEPNMYEPEYDMFMDSVKTALFLESWTQESSEEDLLEEFQVRPGEIRAKLEVAQWLLYGMAELTRILEFQPLLKEINKVSVRLQYGVKEELLPLVRLREIGRARARLLFKHGLRDVRALKSADESVIASIIGKSAAAKVKEQLDQPIEEPVSSRKRRGQMAIAKYDKNKDDKDKMPALDDDQDDA